jgi:carnitine O-acetyltransferase
LSPYATGAGKKANNGSNGKPAEEAEELDTEPKKLEWNLTPELRTGIRFAETRLSDLICQNDIVALEFDVSKVLLVSMRARTLLIQRHWYTQAYGKSFITRHGFSPDAFVQMAFQAAYFSLYGRTECTYEPAMTKAFLHGRTESIRTVQPESVAFVRSFCSDNTTPREKMDALRAACKRHVDLTRECSKGLGQDRVLYALAAIAKDDKLGNGHDGDNDDMTPSNGQAQVDEVEKARENAATSDSDDDIPPPLPALFRDPGYSTINHSVLSTSNCGNPCLRMFGFGAVVPDGFGIGYIIKVRGRILLWLRDGISTNASPFHSGRCNHHLCFQQASANATLPRYTQGIPNGSASYATTTTSRSQCQASCICKHAYFPQNISYSRQPTDMHPPSTVSQGSTR